MGGNGSTHRRVDKNYLYGLPPAREKPLEDEDESEEEIKSKDSLYAMPPRRFQKQPVLIEESAVSPQMTEGVASPRKLPVTSAARDARERRPRKSNPRLSEPVSPTVSLPRTPTAPPAPRKSSSAASPPPYPDSDVGSQDKYATQRVRPTLQNGVRPPRRRKKRPKKEKQAPENPDPDLSVTVLARKKNASRRPNEHREKEDWREAQKIAAGEELRHKNRLHPRDLRKVSRFGDKSMRSR